MSAAPVLVRLLERDVRVLPDEAGLQWNIAVALTQQKFEFVREVKLSNSDRIDFMVGRIGIEVKVDGAAHAVLRQLMRYAKSEDIDELILFTTRAKLCNMPATLLGKPVHVAYRSAFL